MAQVCPHCGAANRPASLWCMFCRAPLRSDAAAGHAARSSRPASAGEAGPAVSVAEAAPSSEPQWRLELTRKVEAYRERHGTAPPKPPQSRLPFPEPTVVPEPKAAAVRQPRPRAAERQSSERLQIFVDQQGFDFPADTIPAPNHALVPVAPLPRRALAWCIDMGFLGACWGLFVGLLTGFGVEIATNRLAVGICMAILFLLYAQYFGLFTTFGGITPGMRMARLRVVSFDGNQPTPKQLLWRSLGYLAAGGAILLGFLWALWDEDRLCWQDRASQTYLTTLAPIPEHHPAEAPH